MLETLKLGQLYSSNMSKLKAIHKCAHGKNACLRWLETLLNVSTCLQIIFEVKKSFIFKKWLKKSCKVGKKVVYSGNA